MLVKFLIKERLVTRYKYIPTHLRNYKQLISKLIEPRFNFIFKFINHERVQAAHNREHDWSISFTLYRGLRTLPTARVKAPKNFKPNYAMLAKHHTTLPRCDCIGTLRRLYKGMQKNNDPHSYGLGQTITLPSG
jgi:hypothetical protein